MALTLLSLFSNISAAVCLSACRWWLYWLNYTNYTYISFANRHYANDRREKPNDPSTTISGCLEFQIKVSLLAANNKSELFRVEKSLANCGTPHSSISLDSLFNINWQLVPRSLWLNIKCGHLVMPCELTETKVNESFTSLITPCSGFF